MMWKTLLHISKEENKEKPHQEWGSQQEASAVTPELPKPPLIRHKTDDITH